MFNAAPESSFKYVKAGRVRHDLGLRAVQQHPWMPGPLLVHLYGLLIAINISSRGNASKFYHVCTIKIRSVQLSTQTHGVVMIGRIASSTGELRSKPRTSGEETTHQAPKCARFHGISRAPSAFMSRPTSSMLKDPRIHCRVCLYLCEHFTVRKRLNVMCRNL